VILVAENEPQHVQLVRPLGQGGYGLDALWNDDLHHSAIVAVTGRREAYYSDHLGAPQELISAAKRGYLFQGQRYAWQKKPRGTPAFGIQPAALVTYLQNHDQVANSARGLRLHALTSPGRLRAITAFVLLAPGTPMLFQGQELAASQPFLYFSDHRADLAERVRNGRVRFLAQFPSVTSPDGVRPLEDPADPRTFERCKLALSDREREPHARVFALHRDLLKLRREDPAFNAPRPGGVDGAVIGPEAFLLRFFTSSDAVARHEDRLLLVNLGRDLDLSPAPEPLLAPPEGMHWGTLWSSEAAAYGGMGTPPVELDGGWHVPGHAAVVLAPAPLDR
jgi:maltooligosyltrehalose trehalohydrolase